MARLQQLGIPVAFVAIMITCVFGLAAWFQSALYQHEQITVHHGAPAVAKAAVEDHTERRIDKAHPDAASKADLQIFMLEIRNQLKTIKTKQDEIAQLIKHRRR